MINGPLMVLQDKQKTRRASGCCIFVRIKTVGSVSRSMGIARVNSRIALALECLRNIRGNLPSSIADRTEEIPCNVAVIHERGLCSWQWEYLVQAQWVELLKILVLTIQSCPPITNMLPHRPILTLQTRILHSLNSKYRSHCRATFSTD